MRARITCDGHTLYDSYIDKYKVIEPKCDIEVNKSGTLSFQIPQTHPHYGDLFSISSVIKYYEDDRLVFKGRFMEEPRDFYNTLKVECEGAWAYLLDSSQTTYNFKDTVKKYVQLLINRHNVVMGDEDEKKFIVGRVTVKDPDGNNVLVRASSQYPQTYDEIEDKLINELDGTFFLDYETMTIDYLAEEDLPVSGQTIKFAENLLELEQLINRTDLTTILIPHGAKIDNKDQAGNDIVDYNGDPVEKRVDIKSVNGGKEYIVSDLGVALFGHIERTEVWDDVEQPQNLLDKGNKRLGELLLSSMTLDVKAVDLNLLGVNTDRFNLGEMVPMYSPKHDVDFSLQLSKISIDIANPANTRYVFGKVREKLTDEVARRQPIVQTQSITTGDMKHITYNDPALKLDEVQFTKYGQSGTATLSIRPSVDLINAGNLNNRHFATLGEKVKPLTDFYFTFTSGMFNGSALCKRGGNVYITGTLSWEILETIYSGEYTEIYELGEYAKYDIYKLVLTGTMSGTTIRVEFTDGYKSQVVSLTTAGTHYITVNDVYDIMMVERIAGSGNPSMTIQKMNSKLLTTASYITEDKSGKF